MIPLSETEMLQLSGGDYAMTWCGIAVGGTLGATLMYGGIGFALTINKAFTLCTLAILA